MGSGSTDPLILNFGPTFEIGSQINVPAGLQTRKEPKVLNEDEGD
jgi:hypothetical protein